VAASSRTRSRTEPNADAAEAAPSRKKPFWREFPVMLVLAFLAALLIKGFLLQAFYIPSESMEPTLVKDDRVLVEKVGYRFGDPERGDVIVFERDVGALSTSGDAEPSLLARIGDEVRELFGFPTGTKQDFIKRVIAVEGETVEGRGGRVLIDGSAIDEPYLAPDTETGDFGPIRVPSGGLFMMGDNRNHSDDSRNYGPIDESQIVGRAFVLIWPPADVGGL
jgi:signal peptidase I